VSGIDAHLVCCSASRAYDPTLDRDVAIQVLHAEIVRRAGGTEIYLSDVRSLIAGWFAAVERLTQNHPQALRIACEFLGEPGKPIAPAQYQQMAAGVR
tara:strand:+ start:36086 stop:36379 length:294 start_codon:yes stop_codon:yes gene_type:complete